MHFKGPIKVTTFKSSELTYNSDPREVASFKDEPLGNHVTFLFGLYFAYLQRT